MFSAQASFNLILYKHLSMYVKLIIPSLRQALNQAELEPSQAAQTLAWIGSELKDITMSSTQLTRKLSSSRSQTEPAKLVRLVSSPS